MSAEIFFTDEIIRIIKNLKSHVYYDYSKDELLAYVTPPEEFETHPSDLNLVYLGPL